MERGRTASRSRMMEGFPAGAFPRAGLPRRGGGSLTAHAEQGAGGNRAGAAKIFPSFFPLATLSRSRTLPLAPPARCHIPNVLLGWGCSWVGDFRIWGVIGREASGVAGFPAFSSSGRPEIACPREALPRRGRPLATGDRRGRAARARQRRTSGWCQPDTALKIFPKSPCPGVRFPLPCACPPPRCPAAHPKRSAKNGYSHSHRISHTNRNTARSFDYKLDRRQMGITQ